MNTLTLDKTKTEVSLPKQCRTCLFTEDIAKIYEDGECEYCRLQTKLRNEAREPFYKVLERIEASGKGKRYDCLIGISGGEDSSVLAYLAVRVWGLRPLVIHFNNRSNRPEADNNIRLLRDKLSFNFIEYFTDKEEYDNLTDALLMAGVQDCDIANDVIMSKLMYQAAKDNGIKYILNGHSFREEGSSPKAWSFIDYTYLNSIFKRFNGHDLENYQLLTVWDQIKGALLGIKQVRPYHYDDHNRAQCLRVLKAWGWQEYGGKHNENIYTAFIGNFVLPRKFGIDKRRTYLSAHIREGKMTKEYANEILKTPAEFDLNDLGDRKEHLLYLLDNSPIRARGEYKMTNFKRLKPIFWILMKFGVLPTTAYVKYCK